MSDAEGFVNFFRIVPKAPKIFFIHNFTQKLFVDMLYDPPPVGGYFVGGINIIGGTFMAGGLWIGNSLPLLTTQPLL